MHDSGLLVLTKHVSHLCRGDHISRIVSNVKTIVATKLYVHLENVDSSQLQNRTQPHLILNSPTMSPSAPPTADVLSFLMKFYSEAALQCGKLDVNVLLHNVGTTQHHSHHLNTPINCIISDCLQEAASENHNNLWLLDMVKVSYRCGDSNDFSCLPVIGICGANPVVADDASVDINIDFDSNVLQTKGSVVLGGTFDHIHAGHKILLSEAILLTENRLLIGVTARAMLGRKTLTELIKPYEERAEQLRDFVRDVSKLTTKTENSQSGEPHLEVVRITDPIGPAGTDPQLTCIVVSQETLKGGEMVNDARRSNGLNPVNVHVIGGGALLQASVAASKMLNESKVSSSTLRYESLGTLRRCLKKRTTKHAPNPAAYIIGLTGGIACGKTSIAARLDKLGAAVINCDYLGHQAYLPGTATFAQVVARFGADVVSKDGTINRAALGAKVFKSSGELDALNAIVWPEIKRLALLEVDAEVAKNDNCLTVCILDAAVLLEAGWEDVADEVWAAVLPPGEAASRVMKRDGRTKEDAERRIAAQLSNQERVDRADVVLSTQWKPEETQLQVERAWSELQKRIQSEAPQHSL